MPPTRTRRPLTLLGFALVFAAWSCATPVGEVSGHTYAWVLERGGSRLQGHTRHEVRGWGAPFGPWRRGVNHWSARDGAGAVIDVDEALREDVRRRHPEAAGREGWFVDPGALALGGALGLFLFAATSMWWLALTRARPRPGALKTAALTVWPWLLGTSLAWQLWERTGHPEASTPHVVDPELMLSGTVLLLALGLVVTVTRGRTDAEEA